MLLGLVALALADDPAVPPGSGQAEPQDPCETWQSPSLQRRLDRLTDSVERPGNRAHLLVDGVAACARRQELTAEADVILVKTFIWSDDAVGRAAAALLADRARAGATVIVQYDFKGSTSAGDWARAWGMGASAWVRAVEPFRTLAAAGVVVVPTGFPGGPARRTPSRVDRYDHEKYWITGVRGADGALRYTAITGGMNVASEYMYGGTGLVDPDSGRGGWRDTDVELEGPVVGDIVQRYFDVLEGELPANVADLDLSAWIAPQAPAGDADVRFVWAHPAIGRRHAIERLYRGLIRATPPADPITVETAYFAPTPPTFRALRHAARSGRPLSVVTNSAHTVDVPFIADAAEAAYLGLLEVAPDAHLYVWRGAPGHATLHSKVALFGQCGPVVIGSANLDGLSAEHNSEGVVAIDDPELRAALAAAVAADLSPAEAEAVGEEALRRRSFLLQWWRKALYAVGWYWL